MTQAADSSRTSSTLYAALLYDGSATISATGFKWGQQPDLSDAQDAAGSATSGAFNAELTGLDFVTTYYYTSYATNTEGTAFGDTLSFTTVAAAPIILSNPATDLAPVSATIHGKITDYGAPDNVTTGFRWGLQADLSNAADTTVTIAADSTFAAVLTGLQDNTTYFFSAYATNATETVFGDTLTFTTYIPITNLNIQSAVNLWTSDEDLALSTYGHISDWDVSNVTLMYDLFQDKSSFNEDISNWDVGKVRNMSDMFKNATAFNQDISSWDVSEVTRIDHMFYQATSFNQPLNVWDVSSVTDMEYMFAFSNFDQDISGWDVRAVTKMNSMFAASIFNQNISSWDVSSVTNMSSMFNGSAFNQPLNAWNVGAVTDMSLVFANSVFDQDISNWNLSAVESMESLFASSAFNQDISGWDVSAVTNMKDMFKEASSFNQDITGWNVSSAKNMSGMFEGHSSFNQEIGAWDVSAVTNMSEMFSNATSFNQDISSWDVGSVTDMKRMFAWATTFNQDLSGWDVSAVSDMEAMFRDAYAFNQDLSSWCVPLISSHPFAFAYSTPTVDLPVWGTCPVEMIITAAEVSDGESSSDAALALTFTSSRSTTNFDETDISVTNGTISSFAGTGKTYTATFTPTVEGECTVDVAGSTYTDALGNENTAADQFNWTYLVPAVFTTCGDAIGYDGYNYATVQIGSQCWFAENLQSTSYNNGTGIPTGLDNTAWSGTSIGAAAAYNNDETNVATYGRLYNWYAVSTGQLCPSGWHVPTDAEWTTLTDGLGGLSAAGNALKSSSSDTPAWDGTNSSGFSALAGGYRNQNGFFWNEGNWGYFWSSSPNETNAWYWELGSGYTEVFRNLNLQGDGMSVRCVLDPPPSMTITAAEVLDGDTSSDATLSLTFTSTASTTDFDVADITVTNGALSNFSGSGTTYTATFTPSGDGACTINVASSTFTDAAGNNNTAADEFNWVKSTCPAVPSNVQGCDAGSLTSLNYQGYDYRLVEIDGECWFAENLRSEQYNNGDAIPGELTDGAWSSTSIGAQAIYNNDASNLAYYGRLYNWYAVNTGDLCPTGWHVPTDAEFTALTDFLGGNAGDKMKSSVCWNGTNESGFSALAGGYLNYLGSFAQEGGYGCFWSSSPDGAAAWGRILVSGNPAVLRVGNQSLRFGFSVRCVRD